MDIIGGGPAGLFCAKELAKKGVPATVHEEHPKIGVPDHCAGLISRRLLDMIPKEDYLVQRVDGARIVCEDVAFSLRRKGVAYVVDRPKLDQFLCEMAESEGATVKLNKKALFSDFSSCVDASGPGSLLRARSGQKLGVLPAVQYVVDKAIDEVEVHFTPLAPEFFAWAIPVGDVTRVGIAARRHTLDAFVKRRFGSPKIISRSAGTVIVGGPVQKTVIGKHLLVGDAAGQVKATTGGGVVMSLLCAKEAACAIAERDPASYERRWRAAVGHELSAALYIRRFLDRVDKKKFVCFCAKNAELLQKKGDMDFHSGVARDVALSPSNWLPLIKLVLSAF